MIQEHATVRPRGRIVLRVIGEDRLLVPVSGEAAHNLCVYPVNSTGARTWELLCEGCSLQQAAERLCHDFDVDPETALADCRTFVEHLLTEQILEPVPP